MKTDNEILIDYMDGQLSAEEISQLETRLSKETELAGEWQYLQMAVETVRLQAIRNQVSVVRSQALQVTEKPNTGILRSMYKSSLRIAAAIICLMGVALLFKYITVTSHSIFDKEFMTYELNSQRGETPVDAEVDAYQKKNWQEVIRSFSKVNSQNNKGFFLAGAAQMELHNFSQAIPLFEHVLTNNTGDSGFREESEYYLSLAYLRVHKESKAIAIWEKIKADPNHNYYPLVSRLSPIDMKIIELKR